jgi:hypothetical protein
MSIIDDLVSHHGVLRQLFDKAMNDSQAFEEFTRHLVVHHTLEEKYFYDILQTFPEAEHEALEAVNEHHIIELIIKDSEGFPKDHDHFPIKIEGLGEYTTHHLDEEEADIFPMSQNVIPAEDLDTLGKLFVEAKENALGVKAPEVPSAIANRAAKPSKRPQARATGSGTRTAMGLGIGDLKA